MRTNYASASKLMGTLKAAKTKDAVEAELRKIERWPQPIKKTKQTFFNAAPL